MKWPLVVPDGRRAYAPPSPSAREMPPGTETIPASSSGRSATRIQGPEQPGCGRSDREIAGPHPAARLDPGCGGGSVARWTTATMRTGFDRQGCAPPAARLSVIYSRPQCPGRSAMGRSRRLPDLWVTSWTARAGDLERDHIPGSFVGMADRAVADPGPVRFYDHDPVDPSPRSRPRGS